MRDIVRAALAASVVLGLAACQTAAPKPDAPERDEDAAAPAAKYEWPPAEGWRPEIIPFPLDFVRDLPLQGVEELRFAPGMFKPGQPGYWSYAFAWWLDGEPALGEADLERDLVAYFRGLATEVAKEKGFKVDAGRFRVELQSSSGAPAKEGHTVQAFGGTADLYDSFVTGKPITLNLDIWVWDCPVSGKRVAVVLASPRATSEPIWKDLLQRRDELLCHRY
jgi:hypothetical protein